MKTKKISIFFILFLSTIANFCSNATDTSNLNINSNFSPKTPPSSFLKTTNPNLPSDLCIISVKSYFTNLRSNHYYSSEQTDITVKKSKTEKFNKYLTKYVKDIYNSKYYANFLSQNGTHIVEFLELGNEININIQSIYTGFRLFYNKMKSCELIDDTVLIQVLKAIPTLLEKYFDIEEYTSPTTFYLSRKIEDKILFKFTEHLQYFNEQPNQFITELSEEIATITKKEIRNLKKEFEEKEILERFRQTIIRFFEISLSKTIWNSISYEGIWESFKSIGNGLQLLGVHSILNHMDDLDDLLWSLVYRFCFFLDLTGSTLPISFYEEIESDIENKLIDFLEAPEQDEGIKTKKEVLSESLIRAKTKAFAFEQRGLFTDQMI
ncbi:hypothetical protein ACFLYH_00140 [Candidatus Dependentiae bacterium]